MPVLEEVAALFPGVTIHAICDDIHLCGKDDEVAAAREELRDLPSSLVRQNQNLRLVTRLGG